MKDEMNAEERDILDKFENGELRSATNVEQEIKAARKAAHNMLNKTGGGGAIMDKDLQKVFISHIQKEDEARPV